jgi:hypothetical protein
MTMGGGGYELMVSLPVSTTKEKSSTSVKIILILHIKNASASKLLTRDDFKYGFDSFLF